MPDRVGPFKVLEKIGAGGAGEVWAAYEEALDRRVALKLVHRSGVADEHEARLLREAHALARLSHPNVVTVHDADRTDDYVYIAMELVEGGTLKSAFANPANNSVTRIGWLLQAARGLQAAHELGLVHRDFKPANALLGNDGRVRVADFGLARLVDAQSPSTPTHDCGAAAPPIDSTFSDLTVTGAILGTPAYMSPEQRLGQRVSAASDQFSFCVVAWQALYGVNPLADLNLAQWVAGEVELLPPPQTAGIPGSVLSVLRRGLDPTPTERHPSMTPILRALESATQPPRRWRPFAMLGAVTVAAVGLAAALLPNDPEPCASAALGWTALRHSSAAFALADGTEGGEIAAALAGAGLRDFAIAWNARARTHCETNPGSPAPCLEREKATYERVAVALGQDGGRTHVPELLATLRRGCVLDAEKPDPAWTLIAQLWPELAVGNAAKVLHDSTQIAASLAGHRGEDAPALQSELVRLRGAAQTQLGDHHGAVETLRIAYNIAERTGSDAVAASVAADLATLTAVELDQPDRGRVWLESAERLERVPPDVQARVAFARGLLAVKDERWKAAADAFARSIELQEDSPAYTDGPTEAWLRQAEALARTGDTRGAQQSVTRAIERRRRLYGDDHPKVRSSQAVAASLQSL